MRRHNAHMLDIQGDRISRKQGHMESPEISRTRERRRTRRIVVRKGRSRR